MLTIFIFGKNCESQYPGQTNTFSCSKIIKRLYVHHNKNIHCLPSPKHYINYSILYYSPFNQRNAFFLFQAKYPSIIKYDTFLKAIDDPKLKKNHKKVTLKKDVYIKIV